MRERNLKFCLSVKQFFSQSAQKINCKRLCEKGRLAVQRVRSASDLPNAETADFGKGLGPESEICGFLYSDIKRMAYASLLYASASTASSHSARVSSPATSMARWENQELGAAPCQCLTPAGMLTTVPGVISTGASPQA